MAPTFRLPVNWAYTITSTLGDPRPYGGHEGVDFAPATRLSKYPVMAAAPGKVIDAGYQPDGYGYFVRIQHESGFESIYGHFEGPPLVKRDDVVQAGQVIGNAGSTGYSTGRHLHFSLLRDGEYLNPLDWIGAAAETAVETISDAVRQLLENDPCAGYADDMPNWITCRIAHGLSDDPDIYMETLERVNNLTDEERIEARAATRMSVREASEGSSILGFFENIVENVKKSVIDGVTWPIRAFVNSMSLADPPLIAGEDTVAWLKEPENQKIYIAANIALLVVVILVIILIAQFARGPVETATSVVVESAVAGVTG